MTNYPLTPGGELISGGQMSVHDPDKFIRSLSAKLATRSRHVCVLLGAGTSKAAGLPDISALTTHVVDRLGPEQSEAFKKQLDGRNLEEALSRLRRIRALLVDAQTIDGLSGAAAEELDKAVCREIVAALDSESANLIPARQFAQWVRRADYLSPVEIFTVNYDLVLETAFDKHKVLYFDGFSGVTEARFQVDLVEGLQSGAEMRMPSFFARLWKLHGSVNWAWQDQQIVRFGHAVEGDRVAAIYPSELKYDESRRFPFVVLQDRFRRSLNSPETVFLISGYAFGDQHLNELIFDAAERRERSEVIALMYGDLPAWLAEKAEGLPNFQVIAAEEAVISGVRGPWKSKGECTYWVSEKFALTDFAVLAKFLSTITAHADERDAATKELLQLMAAKGAGE